MISVRAYLLGLATLVYVISSVIVSAIRWFHMCRPYDEHPDYYYPGRKHLARFSFSAIILVPLIVHPDSTDAWYLAKIFLLPVLYFYVTNLMLSYFGSIMRWQKWKKPVRLSGYPVFLSLTIAFIFALWPGEQIGEGGLISCRTADIIIYALGIFLSFVAINSLHMVWKWVKSFDEDDYSNPADFPVRFALRMIMLHMFVFILLWVNALIGKPMVLAAVMVLLSVIEILFLISALHPQRTKDFIEAMPQLPEEETTDAPETADSPETARQGYLHGLTKEKEAEILYAIQAVVVEQQAYLDPHITLQDIATRCGYSRTYVAGLLKSEFGGFFNFVNTLRMEHAEAYQRAHPEATMQEVAMESGFSSRQTYYTVKSRLSAKTGQ